MQVSHVTYAHARWPESLSAHTNAEFVRCGGAVPRGSNTLDPDSAQPCAPEAMSMARVVSHSRRRRTAGRIARLRAAGVAGAGWTCGAAATLGEFEGSTMCSVVRTRASERSACEMDWYRLGRLDLVSSYPQNLMVEVVRCCSACSLFHSVDMMLHFLPWTHMGARRRSVAPVVHLASSSNVVQSNSCADESDRSRFAPARRPGGYAIDVVGVTPASRAVRIDIRE